MIIWLRHVFFCCCFLRRLVSAFIARSNSLISSPTAVTKCRMNARVSFCFLWSEANQEMTKKYCNAVMMEILFHAHRAGGVRINIESMFASSASSHDRRNLMSCLKVLHFSNLLDHQATKQELFHKAKKPVRCSAHYPCIIIIIIIIFFSLIRCSKGPITQC